MPVGGCFFGFFCAFLSGRRVAAPALTYFIARGGGGEGSKKCWHGASASATEAQ